MRVQRIERLQRIIAIQGVSLVRILNHPSLDRLVGRDSKYPLTQSVGRENLSGCHLAPRGLRPLGARWHPSRFSLPLSFVCGYSRISPFLTLSFGEDLWILTRSPPSITLLHTAAAIGHRKGNGRALSTFKRAFFNQSANSKHFRRTGWLCDDL